VPLAVWPCAQDTNDRAGQSSAAAEIVRRAIALYSEPGDLVLDPLCDDPHATTLLEAIRLGRNALGITGFDPECNANAALALTEAQRAGASGDAKLLVGEPHELLHLLARHAGELLNRRANNNGQPRVARHPCGAVDLVLLAAAAEPPTPRRRTPWRRWSRSTTSELLANSAALLRPGGFLVVAPIPANRELAPGDPAGELVQLCQSHGLLYWQHVIALCVPIRNDRLEAEQRPANGGAQRCHLDLLVLRKPDSPARGGGSADEEQPKGWSR
jgi:hypothetical protein